MLKNTESYWHLYKITRFVVLLFSLNWRDCLKYGQSKQWSTLLFKAGQRIKSREHFKDLV